MVSHQCEGVASSAKAHTADWLLVDCHWASPPRKLIFRANAHFAAGVQVRIASTSRTRPELSAAVNIIVESRFSCPSICYQKKNVMCFFYFFIIIIIFILFYFPFLKYMVLHFFRVYFIVFLKVFLFFIFIKSHFGSS